MFYVQEGRMRGSVPALKRSSAVLPKNGGLDFMCMCNILHIDQEQHRDTLQASHMISGLIVDLFLLLTFIFNVLCSSVGGYPNGPEAGREANSGQRGPSS